MHFNANQDKPVSHKFIFQIPARAHKHPTNPESLPWSQDHRLENKIQHCPCQIIFSSTDLARGWSDPNTERKIWSTEYFQPLWNKTIFWMT